MAAGQFKTYEEVEIAVPGTNAFQLSFDNKLTGNMGTIYPVMIQDTLPGDTFNIDPTIFVRFQPLVFPIMHKIDIYLRFFFVPNFLLWKNWFKFLAREEFVPPYFQGTNEHPLNVEAGSFWDYYGLPINPNIKRFIDALPFLGIAVIYNNYYQDQNNDSNWKTDRDRWEALSLENGLLTAADIFGGATEYDAFQLPRAAYMHDYFTSALPFAQKGQPVNIPLALSDLSGLAIGDTVKDVIDDSPSTGTLSASTGILGAGANPAYLESAVIVDGSSATIQGTINQLRLAESLQKFFEKDMRSGSRPNELIMAHFGVDIKDYRINRPVYIGGIKNNAVISEVLQTSETSETSPLGGYAGHATGYINGEKIYYSCVDHGYIIGLLHVIPTTGYMQGIPKKFTRDTYDKYYWMDLAHIGEQPIKNYEIFYSGTDGDDEDDFGYLPPYSEYKTNPNEIHGQFRTTLKDFHLAFDFATRPVLNEEFIYCNPADTKRIFAVTDESVDSLLMHVNFNIDARRKIPFYSTPSM